VKCAILGLRRKAVEATRNVQEEIKDLEESDNIKILVLSETGLFLTSKVKYYD
jgi:hypothetical protein